jgi:hypothetical protein
VYGLLFVSFKLISCLLLFEGHMCLNIFNKILTLPSCGSPGAPSGAKAAE